MTHGFVASPHTFIHGAARQAQLTTPTEPATANVHLLPLPSRPDSDAAWSAFGLRALREAESPREQCTAGTAVLDALSQSSNDAVARYAAAVLATVTTGGFTYGCAVRFLSRALRRIESGAIDPLVERELARLGQGLRADCQTLREQRQAGCALAAEIERLTKGPVVRALLQWYFWRSEPDACYSSVVEAQERLFEAIACWDAAAEWAATFAPPTMLAKT